jgi:hypothetical protein
MMPDYHGYRYEVKEVAGNFCGTVWPLEAPRATPGLVIVPKASSAAEAERTVKDWIDSENRKNAASGGA